MIQEPNESLSVYFIATLSNNEIFYENNMASWKELVAYCKLNNLKMKNFAIYDHGKIKQINHPNGRFYFAIFDVKASLTTKQSVMTRGYGVTCHVKNSQRCYIEWFHWDNQRTRMYAEVMRAIPAFYENDIGIRNFKCEI